MDEFLIKNIITILFSMVTIGLSIITYMFGKRKATHELKSLYFEKVIDKRIESYPELWYITAHIYPIYLKEVEFSQEWAKDYYSKLVRWYFLEGNGIFLNQTTRSDFFKLDRALRDFFEFSLNGDNVQEQIDLIKKYSDNLRKSMREDLIISSRENESIKL